MFFSHSYVLLLFPQLSNRAVSRSHVKGADIKQRMSLMLRLQRKVRFLLYSFMAVADNCFLSYTYTKFMNIITAAQCWIQSEGSIDLCINQKPSSSSSIYKEKKKKKGPFYKSCKPRKTSVLQKTSLVDYRTRREYDNLNMSTYANHRFPKLIKLFSTMYSLKKKHPLILVDFQVLNFIYMHINYFHLLCSRACCLELEQVLRLLRCTSRWLTGKREVPASTRCC